VGDLPISDAGLRELAAAALAALARRGWRVSLAESCTGGWVAKALTDIPGSSAQFAAGYVTYSNRAKEDDLGVSADTLRTEGAVSRATVLAMAAGARRRCDSDLALAVSGIAGPDGGTAGKPVGLVWFGWQSRAGIHEAAEQRFGGDREAVRRQSVAFALDRIAALADASGPAELPTTPSK
jgi:nicotinamide-nucleotide amidase